MTCLINFSTPQLPKIHSGKVRDSIRVNDSTRMIVVTDRLSAFDNVLKTPIPHKGAVLNGISNFWFEKTREIIGSHFIKAIDPNITLVKEAVPIRVEMIVRGY
ncbi:MAG: phosphoribosylaminoimidazolesuccinocarboxamide synthase, partial [bacterium]|nr:phosphoribosylaminoimidazolesuccinocarboxamide synthase [bacterium]